MFWNGKKRQKKMCLQTRLQTHLPTLSSISDSTVPDLLFIISTAAALSLLLLPWVSSVALSTSWLASWYTPYYRVPQTILVSPTTLVSPPMLLSPTMLVSPPMMLSPTMLVLPPMLSTVIASALPDLHCLCWVLWYPLLIATNKISDLKHLGGGQWLAVLFNYVRYMCC